MAKKQVQLQIEVNSDEEWEKLLQKKGLIVVDVYSAWCGPCSAMQANLKKVKIEVGGDNLVLAVACADHITALERFRNKSEPTWMFLSGGKLVNLMLGANAPKLTQLMIDEIQNEIAAREMPGMREVYEVTELTPEEKARFNDIQKLADEAEQKKLLRQQQALHERRLAVTRIVLSNVPRNGVILVFPHARSKVIAKLVELWEPAQLAVSNSEKPKINEKMIEELLYFSDQTFSEFEVTDLASGPALCYLIKHTLGDDFTGSIDDEVLRFIYGESKCIPGDEGSPAQLLMGKVVTEKPVEVIAAPSTARTASFQVAAMGEMQARSAVLASRSTVKSMTEASRATLQAKSKSRQSRLISRSFVESLESQEAVAEVEPEYDYFIGIWAPPNDLVRATAIKLFFPKIYDPIALPEPVPTPPHIAIAYEAHKRRDVLKLMQDYPDDVMRYGFFTDDNAETAQIVAKTVQKFEKILVKGVTGKEKLVIQLSRKRSEAWSAFAQLNPTFMSLNTTDGEEQCKMFFSEGYDVVDEEEEDVPVDPTEVSKQQQENVEVEVVNNEDEEEALESEDEFDEQEDEATNVDEVSNKDLVSEIVDE